MIILGIESSCDDTSVALLDCSDDGFIVLSEKTASQIDVHKKYGGVVPEIAGRMHAENILPVVESVMSEWRQEIRNEKATPDVIAVTTGPGLITGLLVGAEVAKTLSYLWDVPLIPVNHIEGHIHSVFVSQQTTDYRLQKKSEPSSVVRRPSSVTFPALCLIVSGGHTELVLMKDFGTYELIGKTRDDAAGEAFDKVGKLLGFDYPGGPKISTHAIDGDPTAIKFPRPMIDSDDYDFSFAGLKTAALYWLRDNELALPLLGGVGGGSPEKKNNSLQRTSKDPKVSTSKDSSPDSGRDQNKLEDFCASFEQAIIDVLITKTQRAAKEYNAKTIILGGGVSANKKLHETLTAAFPVSATLCPLPKYTMDNAAMVAAAAYHRAKKGQCVDWRDVVVNPNWKVYA